MQAAIPIHTDRDLIDRLKDEQSRELAFRELVTTQSERLYHHIRRLVTFHHDANDVLQNTFIKAYKGLDGFRGESGIYTWLYTIATREAFAWLKKKKTTSDIDPTALAEQLRADVLFDGNEIQRKLQVAIASLPEKQRAVFVLKYFDDLKYKEIAEITETSEGALKASYFHAVNKIKAFLSETD